MQPTLARSFRLYRDAYVGHPKEIWALAVLTFLNRVGTMVLPFLSVYLTTVLGFSLREAGLLASAFGLGSLGGAFFGGRLSDRWGPLTVIMLSLSVGGGLLIALQFATRFPTLFLLIFLASLFGEAYRPAMSAAVGNYVPSSETGRSMAFLRLAINLGMSAAPAIGGLVATTIGYDGLFWIDGLTCLTASVFLWFTSRRWTRPLPDPSDTSDPEATGRPPYRNGAYLLFVLGTFLVAFGFLQWFHTVPVFLKNAWGLNERSIGLLLAVSSALVVVIEMPLIHVLEKAGVRKGALLSGMVLIAAAYLVYLLPPALALGYVAVTLLTLGEILYLPFNNALPLTLSPKTRRGDYMAWYYMAWSVANIATPLVGLTLADALGFSFLWMILALAIGISFVLLLLLAPRLKL
ncbi:Predicted arabinose efflux permease, MFS family [Catalinimonas alkaloidigena]|uniref:Predicted arabinose efflux permease, MFS family n=1 Tax=Catalinimonas alkaloidigena TaxID=1075417 RepID=A0A1G9UN99_9BACT|nr:MFS transporter [Catalinimonas alkaloidigena]SDM61371.1 Predicted arabinose efflux permease, MFS family [Catalinimonas alkaloidigena]